MLKKRTQQQQQSTHQTPHSVSVEAPPAVPSRRADTLPQPGHPAPSLTVPIGAGGAVKPMGTPAQPSVLPPHSHVPLPQVPSQQQHQTPVSTPESPRKAAPPQLSVPQPSPTTTSSMTRSPRTSNAGESRPPPPAPKGLCVVVTCLCDKFTGSDVMTACASCSHPGSVHLVLPRPPDTPRDGTVHT